MLGFTNALIEPHVPKKCSILRAAIFAENKLCIIPKFKARNPTFEGFDVSGYASLTRPAGYELINRGLSPIIFRLSPIIFRDACHFNGEFLDDNVKTSLTVVIEMHTISSINS